MFKRLNQEGFYEGEQAPKLAEAEVLFFGLIQSGAVKLEPIPMPKSEQEVSFINDSDPEVVKPLEHNLEVLASLYEHCRRYAARSQS